MPAGGGLAGPEAGHGAGSEGADRPAFVARPRNAGPFALELHVEAARAQALEQRLAAAGAVPAQPPALELARVLAGWPRLGAEIDEKSLPQEVRYDELDGVSYTKGCYTGQETVARNRASEWRLRQRDDDLHEPRPRLEVGLGTRGCTARREKHEQKEEAEERGGSDAAPAKATGEMDSRVVARAPVAASRAVRASRPLVLPDRVRRMQLSNGGGSLPV